MYKYIKFEDGTEGYIRCEGVFFDTFIIISGLIILIREICRRINVHKDKNAIESLAKQLSPKIISKLNKLTENFNDDIKNISINIDKEIKKVYPSWIGKSEFNIYPTISDFKKFVSHIIINNKDLPEFIDLEYCNFYIKTKGIDHIDYNNVVTIARKTLDNIITNKGLLLEKSKFKIKSFDNSTPDIDSSNNEIGIHYEQSGPYLILNDEIKNIYKQIVEIVKSK